MNTSAFDEFARTLDKMLPKGAADLKAEFERNAKAAMQSALGNLDVVTREEFDIQARVLARTREKLEALELRVDAMERSMKAAGNAAGNAADQSDSSG